MAMGGHSLSPAIREMPIDTMMSHQHPAHPPGWNGRAGFSEYCPGRGAGRACWRGDRRGGCCAAVWWPPAR